ncbi:MAG: LemA family protein [Candidatus Omnitrophica bacterium]|nr:LemA family protein [Candidatus Omnitrophota bacterium]
MNKGLLVLLIVVFIIIAAGGWFVGGLNRAVVLDENVNQAWAQVENQLQRRNDLIPNLVSTVKGYAQQEKEIFTEVTKLRSDWQRAKTREKKMEAAAGMDNVLSRLLLVAENYPQLKSNQNFLTLQSQLEGTENRIAVERRRYNETVAVFNAYRRTVFGSLFTTIRGINRPAEYFAAEETARAVPRVEF